MKKSKWSLLAMLFALVLVLAACGDKTEEENGNSDEDEEPTEQPGGDVTEVEEGFAAKVTNEGDAIEGGTLMVGMQKDEPFQGIFSYAL